MSTALLEDHPLTATGTRDAGHALSTSFANVFQITTRYLRSFSRQPFYILVTLVQPVVWLFLFGQLFKSVTQIPGFTAGGSYLGYLTPGIVAMTALMSNGWSGMAYV